MSHIYTLKICLIQNQQSEGLEELIKQTQTNRIRKSKYKNAVKQDGFMLIKSKDKS